MKTKTLAIIFLLISMSISAQEKDKMIPQKSYLTLNLMSSIVSYSPRWDIGFIKPLNEKWYVGLEAGYGTYNSSINFTKNSDRTTEKYKLWEFRPQLYYILNPSRKAKAYFSGEFFYIQHTDTFSNSFFNIGGRRSNPIEFRYDTADYKRKKIGLNINFGMLIQLTKDVGFNFSTGLGVRNRNVTFSNIINLTESEREDESFSTNGYLENSGDQFGLNFIVDLKFYVKL